MAQYLLILHGGNESFRSMTPDQVREVYGEYFAWSDKMQREGRLKDGNELQATGRIVERNGSGIVDGPFTETKESVGGYFVIEAAGYDDAVETAKGCPILGHGGSVEVRECVDHSGAA